MSGNFRVSTYMSLLIGVWMTWVGSCYNYNNLNHSCADWMENTYDDPLEDGYYVISEKDYPSTQVTVYCHFNYTSQYAWTLVESFSLNYYSDFKYYAFYESYDYDQSYVSSYKDSHYRMSLAWMQSIFETMNDSYYDSTIDDMSNYGRKMISTCNFDTDLTRDYLVLNLDDSQLSYNPLYDYWSSYTCLKAESVNIRGYECNGETVYAYNYGYHFDIYSYDSSSCTCHPWAYTASTYERSFGLYYYYNTDFGCTETSTSTTNWWLAGYVPQHEIPSDIMAEFMYFENVTCNSMDLSYAKFEDKILEECLTQCKTDNDTECRYAIYLESQKGDNDHKCFLFSEWCEFINDNSGNNEMVFVLDYNIKSYNIPTDWDDKYGDNCDDYTDFEWCVNGIATKEFNKFYRLRDRTQYNLTAIDACGECSGGVSSYNSTFITMSVGLPIHSTLESLIDNNDHMMCDWDIQDMIKHNVNKFDKAELYSICYQYITRMIDFYNNKQQSSKCALLDYFDCDVLSLRQSPKIQKVKINLCQLTQNYMNQGSTTTTNFILAIGSNNTYHANNSTNITNFESSIYNVYLNTYFIDSQSIYLLNNDFDIIVNKSFESCSNDLYNTSINTHTALWLPCNFTDTENHTDTTTVPSEFPTNKPTPKPTGKPTDKPIYHHTNPPTNIPTGLPSRKPSAKPTDKPNEHDIFSPTLYPTYDMTSTVNTTTDNGGSTHGASYETTSMQPTGIIWYNSSYSSNNGPIASTNTSKNTSNVMYIIIGASVGGILIILIVIGLCIKYKRNKNKVMGMSVPQMDVEISNIENINDVSNKYKPYKKLQKPKISFDDINDAVINAAGKPPLAGSDNMYVTQQASMVPYKKSHLMAQDDDYDGSLKAEKKDTSIVWKNR